ncbi:MAG: transglutaminase-like domain-containing protein [Oscillospiraceae bacterium]
MKNKGEKSENAVWLDENISIKTNKLKVSKTTLFRCATLLLCVFSVLLTMNVAIEMPINRSIINWAVSLPIIFTLINDMKKFKLYAIISSILLLFIAIYLFRLELLYAVQIIRSNFMIAFNRYYGTDYLTYDVRIIYMSEYERAKTIFMKVFTYMLSGYFAYKMKMGKSIFPLLILFVPLFWGAINFGFKPHTAPILLILFSFMSICALESQPRNHLKHIVNKEFTTKIFKRFKIHFYQADHLNTMIANRNWISVLALTMSLVILILMIFPQGSYKPNKRLELNYNNFGGFFNEIKDKVSTGKLPIEFSQSGVGGGDLTSIDREGFSEQTHLRVTTEHEVPMLLKGYVGSVYEGNKWSDLDQSVYDANAGVFLRLSNYDITPQTIMTPNLDGLLKYVDKFKELLGIDQDIVIENSISVENIKANINYAYVPYGLKSVTSDKNIFIRDTTINGESFGREEYTSVSRILLKQNGEYSINDMEVYSNYASAEVYNFSVDEGLRNAILDYEKFVYDYYLTMPSDTLAKLKVDFPPVEWSNTRNNIDIEINRVQEYLKNHAVYDLAPGKKPKDKDYIEYFLYENHKGYCSHFATAATMMFRAMGVPARYVEGYTLTQNDIKFNRSDGGEILIKDSNAHAWTEVYLPMYGWVAVDVTPGSSDESIADPAHDVPLPEYMQSSSDVSSSTSNSVSSETSSEIKSSSNNTSSTATSSNNTSSSLSSDTSSSTSTTKDRSSPKRIGKVGLVVLAFLGVISAFFLVLGLKRKITVFKRKLNFKQNNTNKAVVSIYSYITDILSFLGHSKFVGETELEYAKRVTNECEFLDDKSFIEVTELTLKASFSDCRSNKNEVLKSIELSQKLSNDVFESMKNKDKFKYWLIDNLK